MAKVDRPSEPQQETLTYVRLADVYPNPWNVNVMSPDMYEKERASIRRYGMVDPLTIRVHPWEQGKWQLIDGEHRWRAAADEGHIEVPAMILDVDDDTAQELGLVLNETRGSADSKKLRELVASLAARRDEQQLREVLPFSRERFDEMVGKREAVDYASLDEKPAERTSTGQVERVYRMPREVAELIDEAVRTTLDAHQLEHDWQALEVMAAEAMAS